MLDLIRLVYASRAKFADAEANALSANVSRIVMQSRKNNPARGLVGALLYADGCFFQVLEGPSAEVEQLYEKLHRDDRHGDLKVLSRSSISQLSFGQWSMKYVPKANEIRIFLTRHGLSRFDPYQFDARVLDDSIKMLIEGPDAAVEKSSASTNFATPAAKPVTNPNTAFAGEVSQISADILLCKRLSIVAMVMAASALLLAIFK